MFSRITLFNRKPYLMNGSWATAGAILMYHFNVATLFGQHTGVFLIS
jgi:hypothetical protein